MKNTIFAILLTSCCIAMLSACKHELQETSVQVTSVKLDKNDVPSILKATQGNDTLLFTLKDASYTRGMAFAGDSVNIHFIEGHGDTLRALVVTVKPKASNILIPGTSQKEELVTRPAEE